MRLALPIACHVHEDARRAVRGIGFVDRGCDAGGVGDVAGAGHGAPIAECGVDRLRHLLGQRGIAVEHGHLGAQAGQFACGSLAEARCATGDEGGLSLNLHVGVLVVALTRRV